jgi:hypothetical protein
MKLLRFLNPSVHNHWLFLAAGLVWSGVGILLCALAYGWLVNAHSSWALWMGAAGLALAVVIYRFGFAHIARSNIQRLHGFIEKACLFAFFPWKSYLLMVGMMGLGMALRNSPIPKFYLALLYESIGGAMILSSLHYYLPALTTARARWQSNAAPAAE